MLELWRFIGWLIAGVLGGGLVWTAASYDIIRLPNSYAMMPTATLEITYADFVSVLLTFVTVVLAAVAIGVGVVAAYTIRNLREEAQTKLDKAFKEKVLDLEKKIEVLGYNVSKTLEGNDDYYTEEDMEDR